MEGPAVLIRQATTADAAVLAAFGARTFLQTYAETNDPQAMRRYTAAAFTPERIAAELAEPDSVFLLAYREGSPAGEPIGYGHLRRGAPDGLEVGRDPVELVRIYLDRSAIGSGHGSVLLHACLDRAAAAGHRTIWLGVWEHNGRARRFYERWGFRQVGAVTFTLGEEAQTDQLMARALEPLGGPPR